MSLTVFVCANCARPGVAPTCAARPRPSPPRFDWPLEVTEVVVPCTGRLQPEHLLKALECGADAVCIIACEEDNCHHLEGSRRVQRRTDYVRQLLDEIGLGAGRLMLFHLPGSAKEDMALGAAVTDGAARISREELAKRMQAIREKVVARLKTLPRNPLQRPQAAVEPAAATDEVDGTDDSEE